MPSQPIIRLIAKRDAAPPPLEAEWDEANLTVKSLLSSNRGLLVPSPLLLGIVLSLVMWIALGRLLWRLLGQ